MEASAQAVCRACRGRSGDLVLDLADQPACDAFPRCDDLGPDPLYPLQMWLCSSCGLAQLVSDPTVAEEPRGREPEALVSLAVDAIERVATAGWLEGARGIAEYGSPHGGSWLEPLASRGLMPVREGEPADVVLDCFGMMHARDQFAALAERLERVAPDGVLLLQYHALATILQLGQWNALRHGHYAYYSTTALTGMLLTQGFSPRAAWQFDLYGGTVLLAATRDATGTVVPDDSVDSLLAEDARAGVRSPEVLGGLQCRAQAHAMTLHSWLVARRITGKRVLGYGAASRAVSLLLRAGVDRRLLPGVVDASPAKHGLRMPGTDVPILDPTSLALDPPDEVLLLIPDLLTEVRAAFPFIESSGGRWVDAESLGA